MYWVISGPSGNPLTGTIILKQGQTAWEQVAPYLPVLTALVSAVGIWMTYLLANRAREIATQQKKIAEDKLEIDAFDKIYNVIQAYDKFFALLLSSELTEEEIKKGVQEFMVSSGYYRMFFEENLHFLFLDTGKLLTKFADFRQSNLSFKGFSSQENKAFQENIAAISPELGKLRYLLNMFVPDVLKKRLLTPIPTIFPASPDKPQPAAPVADQSPPTP